MKPDTIYCIANPASSAGKTEQRLDEIFRLISAQLHTDVHHCITRKQNDAIEYARHAVNNNAQLIIIIGGDGTINEVVNGILTMRQTNNRIPAIAIINSGTGQGFALSLGIPHQIPDQVRLINSQFLRIIDVCKLYYIDVNHKPAERFFVNECQIGIGADIIARNTSLFKKLGGKVSFGLIATKTAFRYNNNEVTLSIDDESVSNLSIHGISIGNGNLTGGGMKLTPQAILDDGKFDILIIRKQSVIQRLWNFSKIYQGTHILSNAFTYTQAHHLTLSGNNKIPVAVDGELVGTSPCKIEILHNAITVIAPDRKETQQ